MEMIEDRFEELKNSIFDDSDSETDEEKPSSF